MPLESFVTAVKKIKQHQTVQQNRFDPSKPIPNLIDATGEQTALKPLAPSHSTSINAIAKELEAQNALKKTAPTRLASWEKCLCLKRSGEKLFCTKFLSLCVKEKCPKNVIEM